MKKKHTTGMTTAPVTRQGRTHHVPRPAPTPPAPPRDWDMILLRAELAVAAALAVVTVVWSTVSIGDLLGGTWAAYGGAAVFDTAWVAVLGLGWLARYQPARRKQVERVGLFLLLVSMVVITYHGSLHGSLGQGAAGAGIALGSKLLWSTVISHMVCELDPETLEWVDAEHREAHAMLATATVHRQSERARGQAAAHRLAVERRYGVQLDEHQVQRADEHQVLDVEPEPEPWAEREDAVRRATVDDLRARAIASTHGTAGRDWRSAMGRANASMVSAMESGATQDEVLDRVERQRAGVRPVPGFSPDRGGYPQVSGAGKHPGIRRPDHDGPEVVPDEHGPQDEPDQQDEERVPAQRPPSARAVAMGLARHGMGPDAVRQVLAAMGQQVSPDTVSRYVREARQPQPAAVRPEQAPEGFYP
ncbi:hypothetical protein ACWGCC_37910 [Streptomyces nigrescens]